MDDHDDLLLPAEAGESVERFHHGDGKVYCRLEAPERRHHEALGEVHGVAGHVAGILLTPRGRAGDVRVRPA
jgi:hypothetical protein